MRQRVAVDVDALDIGARAFADVESDRHRPRFGIAAELGIDVSEGIAEEAGGFAQAFHCIFHKLGVVPVARLHRQQALQRLRLEVAQLALHVDVAEFIALAFLHHIGDDEVLLVAGQLRHRRNHAEVGIAVLEIEEAQLLLVIGQTIGIVGRVRRQDIAEAGLLRRHFAAQFAVAELFVADDVDLADLRLRPFVDLEHHIDAVLVELDHLGIDGRGEAALPLVEFDDARDVGADLRAGEDLTRRELDLGPDLVFLQPLVAFEDDAVDDGVFRHLDRQRAIVVADLIILEQFGRRQILERLIEHRTVIGLPHAQAQIGEDRLCLEPLVADDGDRLDRGRGRRRLGRRNGQRRCHRRRGDLRQRRNRPRQHRPGQEHRGQSRPCRKFL